MTLPEGLKYIKSTPIFTHENIPAALLNKHSTKAGVWGLIKVESGCLKYVITETGHESEHLLTSGNTAVIVSQQTHFVEPQGDVAFHVDFYQ